MWFWCLNKTFAILILCFAGNLTFPNSAMCLSKLCCHKRFVLSWASFGFCTVLNVIYYSAHSFTAQVIAFWSPVSSLVSRTVLMYLQRLSSTPHWLGLTALTVFDPQHAAKVHVYMFAHTSTHEAVCGSCPRAILEHAKFCAVNNYSILCDYSNAVLNPFTKLALLTDMQNIPKVQVVGSLLL